MSARAQTVRLTPAQHRTLGGFAKTYGLSEYAMLARVVDAGLAALVHGADSGIDAREIVAELASVNTSIVDLERMQDRALFPARSEEGQVGTGRVRTCRIRGSPNHSK